MRTFIAGTASTGLSVGKEQRRREVIGQARRHAGEEISRRRTDHHEVGLAAELDVSHLDLVLQVPQAGMNLVLRQSRERHRRDELRSALGQHAGDGRAAAAQQPDQLARFVSRDAAADDEEDALALHDQ
jgi:hypothetical protein